MTAVHARKPAAARPYLAARASFIAVGLWPWLLALVPPSIFSALFAAPLSLVCHRRPERTLVLAVAGHAAAMPLCSRCAGIFAGLALGAAAARPMLSLRAARIALAAAAGLMLVEVALQDLQLRPLSHVTRLGTGLLLGYLVAAAVMALIAREIARVG